MQTAFTSLLWSIERKARLYCCSRKMSVTCLFFSPNKLIDYFPALRPVRVSTRYLHTSVKQTRHLAPLPYPSSKKPPILHYQLEAGARLGAAKNERGGLSSPSIANLLSLYKKNTFNTPIPAFGALFSEHATAPFFVSKVFCVTFSCLD